MKTMFVTVVMVGLAGGWWATEARAAALVAVDDEELDPGNLDKGDTGKLPKTTKTYFYQVASVYDEDVLVVALETPKDGGVAKPVGRFFFKDADAVAKYGKLPAKGNQSLAAPIEFPDTYIVVGTKTAGNGDSLPRLKVKK